MTAQPTTFDGSPADLAAYATAVTGMLAERDLTDVPVDEIGACYEERMPVRVAAEGIFAIYGDEDEL